MKLSFLFPLAVFLGSSLLFLLEPLAGKALLPWYGGTPTVWNTCVFFFQLLLLLGYFYAHLLQFFPVRRQVVIHLALLLLSLVFLPIRFGAHGLDGSSINPAATLLIDLTKSVGLVFFLLSTTAPLLQAWHAKAGIPGSPYPLYLVSNAASFLSLLIYPAIIEFWWPISRQCTIISWLFCGYVLVTGIVGLLSARLAGHSDPLAHAAESAPANAISPRRRALWLLCSLCPSSLMLSVTTFLSTEIAPMPAIWILPLGIYLLTFIIGFSELPRWILFASSVLFAILSVIIGISTLHTITGEVTTIATHLGVLFFGALAMHGRLAKDKPDPSHLTEFYLWISLGGLFGTVFNSLLAPMIFDWLAEYPLTIAMGLALVPLMLPQLKWSRSVSIIARSSLILIVLGLFSWDIYFRDSSKLVLLRSRNFFGSFQITRGYKGRMHALYHSRTLHGMQVASQDRRERRPPLTYYFFSGPIGQLILSYRGTSTTESVAVVGLGTGSIASYAESGQSFTFYEIDTEIAKIAEDDRYFTFLNDARERGANIQVVIGDARLRLREAPNEQFGLIILDAFTSDAIPVHLLTKDALREYASKLNPNGLIAFHISNIYIDLEPVLANLAAELNWECCVQFDNKSPPEESKRGKRPSNWLVMSSEKQNLNTLLKSGRWRKCQLRPELGVWTDDRSNIFSAMHIMRSKKN